MTPRAPILFGLGKAFDDLGDYAEAMRCYDEANRLRAQWRMASAVVHVRRIEGLMRSVRPGGVRSARAQSFARPDGPGDKPVFIVGMPRSGTTLTEQILSAHPAVAFGGELGFWNGQIAEWGLATNVAPSREQFARAREDYLALLAKLGRAPRG